MPFVYCIENIVNNKKYIGQTTKQVEVRLSRHFYDLHKNNHANQHIQNAFNKYGAENFKTSIIEECSENILDEKECYWINAFHSLTSEHGYNLDSGGNLNKKHSIETKQKISEKHKGSLNPQALIDEFLALDIKNELSKDGNARRISILFNTGYSLVKSIKQLKSWSHISPELNNKIKSFVIPANKISPETRLIVEALKQKGLKNIEISKELNINKETVTKILGQTGKIFKRSTRSDCILTETVKREVFDYHKKGYTQRKIAEIIGVNQSHINKTLKQFLNQGGET